jgi:hypothetical protein
MEIRTTGSKDGRSCVAGTRGSGPVKPAAFLLFAVSAFGQNLTVTATLYSHATTESMFGRLPKRYNSVAIAVCTKIDSPPVTIPLAAIAQVAGAIPDGITVLMPTAALSVIAAAHNRSGLAKGLKIGIAIAEGAAVAVSLSGISEVAKEVLVDTSILGGQVVRIIQEAASPGNLLDYSKETLQDPLNIVPGGCSPTAILLTESTPGSRPVTFRLTR